MLTPVEQTPPRDVGVAQHAVEFGAKQTALGLGVVWRWVCGVCGVCVVNGVCGGVQCIIDVTINRKKV